MNIIKIVYMLIHRNYIISKVNKVLGIKLYKWQKNFIFPITGVKVKIPAERCTGKTLAHCLRLCLSEGEPLDFSKRQSAREKAFYEQYAGEDAATWSRIRYFKMELIEIYYKLKKAGLKLRVIDFGRSSFQETPTVKRDKQNRKRISILKIFACSFLFGLFVGFTPYIFYLADIKRGFNGTGGEILFPFIPIIMHSVYKTLKDIIVLTQNRKKHYNRYF